MDTILKDNFRGQLLDKRRRLQDAMSVKSSDDYLIYLLKEVNSASGKDG